MHFKKICICFSTNSFIKEKINKPSIHFLRVCAIVPNKAYDFVDLERVGGRVYLRNSNFVKL